MSPEALLNKYHSYVSDYFGLGVILYEILLGHRPFHGINRLQIIKQVLESNKKIEPKDINSNEVSIECIDFINALLIKNPNKRLGSKGANELKNHPWMKDIVWEDIEKKRLIPPFKPVLLHDFEYFAKLSCNSRRKMEKIKNINSRLAGYFYISSALQNLSQSFTKWVYNLLS